MLSYSKVQNNPRVLQSLIGPSVSEFEQLLVSFEQPWHDYLEQSHSGIQSKPLWCWTQAAVAG